MCFAVRLIARVRLQIARMQMLWRVKRAAMVHFSMLNPDRKPRQQGVPGAPGRWSRPTPGARRCPRACTWSAKAYITAPRPPTRMGT